VPELDYAFLAEYVHTEGGVAHVLSAGVDTIVTADTPTGQNIGLVFRLGFTRQECGRAHRVEIVFQDEDGVRLAQISTVVTPQWTEGLPVHWRQGVPGGLNFGIPLPRYGLYSFQVMVNDENRKTLHLRVIEPTEPATPNESGADEISPSQ
jgi:hypothetical protein